MITGVDVPDASILTTAGKVVVGITAIFSVGIFAVPAGILGWGFESVGEKFQEHRKQKKKDEQAKMKDSTDDTSANPMEYDLHLSSDDSDEESEEEEEEQPKIPHGAVCPMCKRSL